MTKRPRPRTRTFSRDLDAGGPRRQPVQRRDGLVPDRGFVVDRLHGAEEAALGDEGASHPQRLLDEHVGDRLQIPPGVEASPTERRHPPQGLSRALAGAQHRQRDPGVGDPFGGGEQRGVVRPTVGEQHDVTDLLVRLLERRQGLPQRRGDLGVAFGDQGVEGAGNGRAVGNGSERERPPGPGREGQHPDPIGRLEGADRQPGARPGREVLGGVVVRGQRVGGRAQGRVDLVAAALQRHWQLIAKMAGGTLLASTLYAFAQPRVWEGEFQIVLASEGGGGGRLAQLAAANPMLANLAGLGGGGGSNSLETEVKVLESPSVLKPVYDFVRESKRKAGKNVDGMRFSNWVKSVEVGLEKGTSVLNISYTDTDKKLVLPVINRISKEYQDYSGRDRRKDALLQEHGYFVLRFLAEDVGTQLDHVLDTILRVLASRERESNQFSGKRSRQ